MTVGGPSVGLWRRADLFMQFCARDVGPTRHLRRQNAAPMKTVAEQRGRGAFYRVLDGGRRFEVAFVSNVKVAVQRGE